MPGGVVWHEPSTFFFRLFSCRLGVAEGAVVDLTLSTRFSFLHGRLLSREETSLFLYPPFLISFLLCAVITRPPTFIHHQTPPSLLAGALHLLDFFISPVLRVSAREAFFLFRFSRRGASPVFPFSCTGIVGVQTGAPPLHVPRDLSAPYLFQEQEGKTGRHGSLPCPTSVAPGAAA